jgi:hypothetical protein
MISKVCKSVVVGLLATGISVMCWSQDSSAKASLKQADVKRLVNSATTSEEFTTLASYFNQRAMLFEQKAAEEDAELNRLNYETYKAKNFPIQIDRAQRSGDWDRAEAKKCSDAARAFRTRAAALNDETSASHTQD